MSLWLERLGEREKVRSIEPEDAARAATAAIEAERRKVPVKPVLICAR
jgi:hypothetical protein